MINKTLLKKLKLRLTQWKAVDGTNHFPAKHAPKIIAALEKQIAGIKTRHSSTSQ